MYMYDVFSHNKNLKYTFSPCGEISDFFLRNFSRKIFSW